MGHRQVSNQFMISGPDQHFNNHIPAEQSCGSMGNLSYLLRGVATDNGPFITSMDHMVRGGVHSNYHRDLWGRPNESHSAYVGMEVQHHPPPFPRLPFDPYLHSSTSRNTSFAPIGPVRQNNQSHYKISSVGGTLAGNGGSYKRKNPSISEGSSSSFYGAGSSSSSQMLIEKPSVDHHSLPPCRGSGLSIDSQDSMRSVRSRSELEPWMPRTHVPNYTSHYYQPITHPANYSVPVHPVNLSADEASHEWNSVPYAASSQGRTPPLGINGPRHDESQFYAGGISVDSDAYQHYQFHRRTLVSSSQHLHVPHSQSIRDGHSYHSSRDAYQHNYRNGLSYCNYRYGGGSRTNEQHFPPENISSSYSRYSPTRGSVRGPRITVERLQPIVNSMDSRDALGYESSFYHNSSNLLDRYQDMRLDIDDMSYEELLALEERIGHVNTGLSEDGISKCLKEQVYYSMDQYHEETTCPICLEEYMNGENVGRMEICGHEYHMDCIKRWLLMKKVCPICKSECTIQEPIQA